ncbi:squamosa promoter-binding-like protein 9 isoform X1 [Dioscorea cayenensis subsp. rotundata]|uniref:Squamosa promoter-binding-like protein 9 isoform X1 n=1 Tax=Dioscorea cayennensis subsp. rotundata TaxID=55577 RepID=A0AB40BMS3_DIOCR|nr:squamosa promoter-binding-like protein 9 isoform X1 [Dioscorea cayenensis subsp. rotundata]
MDSSSPPTTPRVSPMEDPLIAEDPSTWEWGTLFDFSVNDDDPLLFPWPGSSQDQPVVSLPPVSPPPAPESSPASPSDGLGRIRKRDPRLVCSNFLAGRVPCACPELDAQEREEEEVAEAIAGARKRVRMSGTAAVVRCQVPGCEVDIRELKGYHRRHRVCLKCANAPSVVLDGEHKRYCQQCGKFHILPDFDEGKRSCRRKLERHNKRRRRRSTNPSSNVEKEKELQGDLLADGNCDAQTKEMMKASATGTPINNKTLDIETILESDDGDGSPSSPVPSFQNVQCNSTMTLTASDETNKEEKIDYSKPALSSTFSNKSGYSSVCPTGRISFKLYDWNPAEFPRRLRHQIFQWLANMPVELEGYIRPGCTILTVFLAMPQFMWEMLSQDVAFYVRDMVSAPESLFCGRGNILVHLSNKIVQVMRDGSSLMNIKMEVQVPRLHYVYPTYFEAGKPMEFVACGSNLDRPKFRFLVSFAGKYLVCNSCYAITHETGMLNKENARNSTEIPDHEMLRISITQTESEVFGPAFIEVENESGLSNFIPVLFGNKRVCSELARIQEAFDKTSSGSEKGCHTMINTENPDSCESLTSRQTAMSDILLDIGWLIKNPSVEESEVAFSSINIQRITCLLEFLTRNEFVNILEEILQNIDHIIGEKGFHESVDKTSDADFELFMKQVNHARDTLSQIFEHGHGSVDVRTLSHGVLVPRSPKSRTIRTFPSTDKQQGSRNKQFPGSIDAISDSDETVPLVPNHSQHCSPSSVLGWPRESWRDIIPKTVMSSRFTAFIMVSAVMCFAACIAVLHPQKAKEFTVTLRRCLFGSER